MKILSHIPEITFDDVLLLPGASDFTIDQETENISLKTRISRNIVLDMPIVSSPMPGVTESEMAIAVAGRGGMGFIHHFQSPNRQLDEVHKVKKEKLKVAATVNDFSEGGLAHIGNLIKTGVDMISIDTEHAFNVQTLNFIKRTRKRFPDIDLNAAVVVTKEGVAALCDVGVDSIRIGVGPGSHCTTRMVTGVGRPQLSAILESYKVAKKHKVPLIAEGGIKYAGDIPKALVFGASAVMIGGLFAGTDETPGEIVCQKGLKYKYSWGMCTNTALNQSRFHKLSRKQKLLLKTKNLIKKTFGLPTTSELINTKNFFEEGVEGLVPYKGSVIGVMEELVNGTRRSMWYLGAKNITELRNKARVVITSQNTINENNPRI